jgi:hypothetical protein
MNVKDLVPKDKFDLQVIQELEKLSFEQLAPIIPNLLEWLQDMNWPVAKPIANVLEPFVDRMIPNIIKILKSDDTLWKLWILISLLRKTTNPNVIIEITRLAKYPSREEIENEVDIEAIAILKGDYK